MSTQGRKPVLSEKKRILYVDDDDDTCNIMQLCFFDYDAKTSSSAAQALLIARKEFFDLYVLDTWMPGHDGVRLCRQIRTFDPNTPILFYSAAAWPEDRQNAILAGADEYIVKPADPYFVRERAESLMAKAMLKDLEARSVELAAIQAERIARGTRHSARETFMVPRSIAYDHFTKAGGTRAAFERFWMQWLSSSTLRRILPHSSEKKH